MDPQCAYCADTGFFRTWVKNGQASTEIRPCPHCEKGRKE